MTGCDENIPILAEKEPVLAVCILLDHSASMFRPLREETVRTLRQLGEELRRLEFHRDRMEFALVETGREPAMTLPWCTVEDFRVQDLSDGGPGSLDRAIAFAMDALDRRRALYHRQGARSSRPALIVIGGDAAGDTPSAPRMHEAIRAGTLLYLPMTADPDADRQQLLAYYPPEWKRKGVGCLPDLPETFSWLGTGSSLPEPNPPTALTLPDVPIDIRLEI